MMRILSWTPTLGCDKMQAELSGTFSAEKFSSALSSSELAGCLKRKRSVDLSCAQTSGNCATPTSVSTTNAHIVHTPVTSQPAPVATTPVVADVTPTPTASTGNFADATDAESTQPQTTEPVPEICPRTKMDLMRDTISSQLSLDILMKHRELRLIDQELAKCQAALEQLRRCTEIPFPGMHQPSEDVSNGTGAAIEQKGQKFQAKSPAPWGVTNSPYTKHYAKWLLPDCRFDGGLPDRPSYSAASTPASARSTRGHFQDFAQLVGKTSRAQRAAQHMSLPAGYVEPKQKPTGPMILKRKSDGKMVKLICPDCGRLDFGSAQGFINHCRIGHQRNFASHDAAAEGCGEPVEYDEAGNMKGVPQQTEPAAVSAAAPAAVVVQTPGSTHVHPLVRSAKLLPPVKPLPRNARGVKSKKAKKPIVKVGTPSPDAPNLSAFMQDKGIDLDLNKFVTEAKASIEPEGELEYDHDDMDIDSPVPQVGGRHPQTGAKLPAGKGLQSRQHRPSHSNNACSGEIILRSVESDGHSLVGMLPSPTNDSTQAPSLIDDDEEMDPQSPPSSSGEIEDREIDFHIQDDDHLEDTQELRGPEHLPTPPGTCAPSPAPLQRPPQAATFITAFTAVPQRQLSFVHETGYSKTDDGPEKKRRKMMGN